MGSITKRIQFFFLIFILSFLAGSVFFIFRSFGLLSLKGYVLETPSAEIEKRFWDLLPSECIRYWPVFVYKSAEISTLMERTLPVLVSTEVKGIGEFHTRISYLKPWLIVEWRENKWCLSKEGYMWSPELCALEAPKAPVWIISDSLNKYSDTGKTGVPDGVFPAVFRIEEITRFDDIFRAKSWYTNVSYIGLERRAGELLLKLLMDINDKSVTLIVNGEEKKLREIDMLLEQILVQKSLDYKDVFIDISYPDKVVVSQAREGSLN